LGLELRSQRFVIVDLAIVTDHPPTVGGMHGLMSLGRQVQDRKAAVPKGDAGIRIAPIAFIVRTTVDDGVGHRPQESLVAGSLSEYANQPAHGSGRSKHGYDALLALSFEVNKLHREYLCDLP
jgi:hypothetical protein